MIDRETVHDGLCPSFICPDSRQVDYITVIGANVSRRLVRLELHNDQPIAAHSWS